MSAPSAGEAAFHLALRIYAPELALRVAEENYFHPTRRWRFDFAFPYERVAIEIDGGQFAPGGGRHATDRDREKLNAAAVLGWRVLRFSPQQIAADPAACVALVEAALANEN